MEVEGRNGKVRKVKHIIGLERSENFDQKMEEDEKIRREIQAKREQTAKPPVEPPVEHEEEPPAEELKEETKRFNHKRGIGARCTYTPLPFRMVITV